MKAAEIKYNGSVIASPEAGQVVTLKCAGKKMIDDLIMEVTKNSGIGDLIEFEIMPETVVPYNDVMQAYVLPCSISVYNQTPYIVVINGKSFMPTTRSYSYDEYTITGNASMFGYGGDNGVFGILCDYSSGTCVMALNTDYFPVPEPVTVRIYKLLNKIDASDLETGNFVWETYQDYAFEDDTIEGFPEYAFSDRNVFSVQSQSAEFIGLEAFNTSSLSVINCPNVRTIGDYAFAYSKGLVDVKLPLIEETGYNGFGYCSGLNVLDFHKLQYIDENAFHTCSSLRVLVIRSESVCVLSSPYAFTSTPFDPSGNTYKQGGFILVPRALIDAYKNETNWSVVIDGGNMILPIEDFTIDGTVTGEFGKSLDNVANPGLYVTIPEINSSAMIQSWESLIKEEIISVDDGVVYAMSPYDIYGTLILPDDGSITAIGDAIFDDEGNISGRAGFMDCYNMTGIVIPDSVTSICDSAFECCSMLTTVNIPNSVTSIGNSAFYECFSLTNITIPNSVTNIDKWAFNNTGLGSVVIANDATNTGVYTYGRREALTSTNIPESVTNIGDYAFSNCNNLTNVTIGKGVVYIGDGAFDSCESLSTISYNAVNYVDFNPAAFGSDMSEIFLIIGSDMETISKELIEWIQCTDLKIDEQNTNFYTVDNIVYDKYGNAVYVVNRETISQFVIPATMTWIPSFENSSALQEVTFEEGSEITSIAPNTFAYCQNLTSVTLPDSITDIGFGTFNGCTYLRSIHIPTSLTHISASMFNSCTNLESCNIPDGITSIDTYAFYGCKKITYITIPDSVISIGDSVFTDSYLRQFNSGSNVESIGTGAFQNCTNLRKVVLSDKITSISDRMCRGCNYLVELTIGNNVESIGQAAFENCSKITSVTIPSSVTSIGNSAFSGCTGLNSVTIPASVTSFGGSAFSGCTSLNNITFEGTTDQWYAIEKGSNWKRNVPATQVQCSDNTLWL